MTKPITDEKAEPARLKSEFGEEADLYAETRAEAAAASGRCGASEKWEEVAERLRDETSDGEDE